MVTGLKARNMGSIWINLFIINIIKDVNTVKVTCNEITFVSLKQSTKKQDENFLQEIPTK